MSSSSDSSNSIQNYLKKSQDSLRKAFLQLSTGKSINEASDNPAGLAIASSLESDAAVYEQANRNIGDAQSVVDITDGALQQVSDITGRLGELAAQSANGTLSDEQRGALQNEYSALTQEIQRIGQTTEFNGQPLLTGQSLTVQAGDDSSASSQVTAGGVDISSLVSSLASTAIDNASSATAAIDQVKNFADNINTVRGNLGSTSARLDVASNNNSSTRVNELSAASKITDADIADATAEATRQKILGDVQTSLLAQAGNINAQRVQDLLK